MKPTLYHTDPYVTENTATVTEILQLEGQYHIQLDDSLFYPEGGGQPCDLGTIDSIPVLAVYENESGVYHVMNALPHTTRPVPCLIDWTRRFDHMQQHTGQHLLSAVMDHLYDAATVGFRLTEDYVTIDLDKKLTEAEIAAAEAEANRLIWADMPVKGYLPDAAALLALPLRKQPKVEENIRIIEVDRYDYSPCCGTHVHHTGEIGFVKISRFENYKEGVRLEFRCGRRGLEQFALLNRITQAMGKELSAAPEAMLPAFERYKAEKEQLKETLQLLKNELLAHEAAACLAAAEEVCGSRVVVQSSDRDMKDLKFLASSLTQNPATVVIFASRSDSKAQLLLQRSADLEQLDMKAVFALVAQLINAKGGGNKNAAQGGGDRIDALDACINAAYEHIVTKLQL